MVTRKSRLETQFTGDDRPFQRVAARVQATGAKMRAMTSGLRGGFVALGGSMLVKSTVDKFDRFDKLSKSLDISSESLQKLGHLADLGGSDLETIAKGMHTLNKNASDAAVHGIKTYSREFEILGIDSKEFFALDHEQRFLAMGDAVRKASNRNLAMAATQKLMGRSGKELFHIMEQSRESQEKQMKGINTLSDEQTAKIAELKDHFTTLAKNAIVFLADKIVHLWNWLKKMGDELARLGALMASVFDPDVSFEDVNRFYNEVKKEREEALAREKKAEEERKKNQDGRIDDFVKGAEKAKKSAKQITGFDPTSLGGFFGHAGRSGISPQVKTWEQKKMELQQSILNELKHSNQFMRKELA